MTDLEILKRINTEDADVTLWLFKKSIRDGSPRYAGRWVETHTAVDERISEIFDAQRNRIEETEPYDLLAQRNEASALTIGTNETHGDAVIAEVRDELDSKQVRRTKHIVNSAFYAIKYVEDGKTVLGVRKADKTWKTKKNTLLRFNGEELHINDDQSFEIMNDIDFFISEETIFVLNKANFESILSYKQAHENEFQELQAEDEFSLLFQSLGPITEYVGTNKIQLRRAHAIRQKGHYKDEDFMSRLRDKYQNFGLNINFDDDGRIIPCEETCRDIFQALLDHRLSSAFSESVYDVQNTVRVGG